MREMPPPPNRRELVLDHGRVFVEASRLMTDDELADVLEAFVKEVRGRPPKQPITTGRTAKPVTRLSEAGRRAESSVRNRHGS
jgi:hypothetical protein